MSYRQNRRSGQRNYRRGRKSRAYRKPKSLNLAKMIQNNISLEETVYTPKHDFGDMGLAEKLYQNIKDKGYRKPTAIQDQVIKLIMEGRDVVGEANTGTGKTAAFLIPLVHKLSLNSAEKALIISPTRELAVQIAAEFGDFSRGMNISHSLCIGGLSLHKQIVSLKKDPQVVIGTPGRLKDLYGQKALELESFKTIVLDEVDQMLDMGFIRDIRFLISKLNPKRQSLFFSATIKSQAEDIMRDFLYEPSRVSVKENDTLSNIEQELIKLNGRAKDRVLHELLASSELKKVIVFGGTKRRLNQLERVLSVYGHRVAAIHGNKSQNQRQRALNAFKRNEVHILLATDVASRGLDIDDVSHVINFDMPQTYEDYIHRIGRTGRQEKRGVALTFVD